MKKYIILTSIFALAACGGGSGGIGGESSGTIIHGAGSSARPAISVQGFDAATTVNENNANLTGMSSYIADYSSRGGETAVKDAMKQYVEDKLGENSDSSLFVRAATNSPRRAAADDFTKADRAIQAMKQVVYDMVKKKEISDTALRQYVTTYKDFVADALKVADQDIGDGSVNSLIAVFNSWVNHDGINSSNLLEKMDEFDKQQFGIEKHRMDDVLLEDTGGEGFFKFGLDEFGAIKSVALVEDPTAEYKNSWNTKKIIIQNGEASFVDANGNLNPFGDMEILDKAGTLVRNGTGTEFRNTLHHYEFELGGYDGEEKTIIKKSDFNTIEIESDSELSVDEAKQRLKDYIIAKANNKLHSQPNDDEDNVKDMLSIIDWYLEQIETTITISEIENSYLGDVAQTATMNGMGKDVGGGLKFSDFGYSTLTRVSGDPQAPDSETSYLTYVGGYEQLLKDPVETGLDNGATFDGTAIITVEHDTINETTNPKTKILNTAMYKDTDAQLRYTVDGSVATHTLTMNNLKFVEGNVAVGNNDDWYSMKVQGTDESTSLSYTFNEYGKNIDSEFKFIAGTYVDNNEITRPIVVVNNTANGNDANIIDSSGVNHRGNNYSLNGGASAKYYGQDEVTEATAGFWMSEKWHNDQNNMKEEVSVYGAFGGKITE